MGVWVNIEGMVLELDSRRSCKMTKFRCGVNDKYMTKIIITNFFNKKLK